MKVLVCNVGSTSLKFKLYEMPGDTSFPNRVTRSSM